jgi:hypothetical protein
MEHALMRQDGRASSQPQTIPPKTGNSPRWFKGILKVKLGKIAWQKTGIEAESTGFPVFFSDEIPRESGACDDLSYFIKLNKSPREWAEKILKETSRHISQRRQRTEEIKAAGFDSAEEARRLESYYSKVVMQ